MRKICSHAHGSRGRTSAGFSALISVILIGGGMVILSLVVMESAYSYYESVTKREVRRQAQLNASSCLEIATVMYAKDVFLSSTTVPLLGCDVNVKHPSVDQVEIDVVAHFNGLIEYGMRTLRVSD